MLKQEIPREESEYRTVVAPSEEVHIRAGGITSYREAIDKELAARLSTMSVEELEEFALLMEQRQSIAKAVRYSHLLEAFSLASCTLAGAGTIIYGFVTGSIAWAAPGLVLFSFVAAMGSQRARDVVSTYLRPVNEKDIKEEIDSALSANEKMTNRLDKINQLLENVISHLSPSHITTK